MKIVLKELSDIILTFQRVYKVVFTNALKEYICINPVSGFECLLGFSNSPKYSGLLHNDFVEYIEMIEKFSNGQLRRKFNKCLLSLPANRRTWCSKVSIFWQLHCGMRQLQGQKGFIFWKISKHCKCYISYKFDYK